MFFRSVEQGQAIIVLSPTNPQPRVSFTGGVVMPWHKAELIDLTEKTVELSVDAESKDGRGLMARVIFRVKINRTPDDILEVARNLGCSQTFEPDIARKLFGGKFIEAVRVAARSYTLTELTEKQLEFSDSVKEAIGRDLDGYHLEDMAVESLLPRDRQTLAVGLEELTIDWFGVRQAGRLDRLISQHRISVLAHKAVDGSVEYAPPGDTSLKVGDELAVAVPSARYEAVKSALA